MRTSDRTRRPGVRGRELTKDEAADQQALEDSVLVGPEAFGRLVERHAGRCLTLARQVLRDEDRAQYAVQQAYLHVWEQTSSFEPVSSPVGPWLIRLTHRQAVDGLRHELAPGTTDPDLEPAPSPTPTPTRGDISHFDLEDARNRTVLGEHTVSLLRALPDSQRQCLMLAYWGGYTTAEIAQLLHTPLGTVRADCSAAMRRLAELLREGLHDARVVVSNPASKSPS